jgi:hypothetical protein
LGGDLQVIERLDRSISILDAKIMRNTVWDKKAWGLHVFLGALLLFDKYPFIP